MARDIEQFELLNTGSQLRKAARHGFEFYRGAIPLDQCEAVVQESYDLLNRNAVVKHWLVALADRWSIDRLRRVGILQERLSQTVPEVLFVDTDDSGLAASAAALLSRYAGGRLHVSSAGEKPAAEMDPAVVRVAGEADIDLASAFPKSITQEAVQVADVIITLGDATSVVEHAAAAERQVLHWEVAAVADRSEDTIRAALVDVDRRTLMLLADLIAPSVTGTS